MASVAKFRMNEAPRLLAHCSRTQKNSGSHIHKDRTELNFNMAYGQHTGLSDYDFVKERTHDFYFIHFFVPFVFCFCSFSMPEYSVYKKIYKKTILYITLLLQTISTEEQKKYCNQSRRSVK